MMRKIRNAHTLLCLLSLLVLGLLSWGTAQAAWVSLGGPPGSPVEVTVLQSTPDRIVLHYRIPGFEAEPIVIDGRTYFAISLPHESTILQKGMPELPHVCRSVIIPDQQRMQVSESEASVVELAGYPVVPSKGTLSRTIDPATVPYTLGPAYTSSLYFPAERVQGGAPYILRDYRGLTVEVLPIQSASPEGTLRVAKELTVVLEPTGTDDVNTLDRLGPPATVSVEFDDVYRQHFLNYGLDRYVPVVERGKMLVITYDAFHDALVPFVNWKNQEGVPTSLVNVSTIGGTASAIDAYITNRFNTEGLTFVLLVGDGAQIPTQQADGGSSDPSYALVLGNDNYPELFVGRFSAETLAQVQTQVDRSVAYERTPQLGASWYHKGTGIGSASGPGDDNEYDYEHIGVIRTKLLGYTYTEVDQIYDPGATAAMVTTALNAGRSVVNYCGHGSVGAWTTTGFSSSNVTALQNDSMLPFIFSVACVNGQFEGGTCFAEAWLRSTRNGNPVGAIGAYMSSINQDWNPPMCAQDAAIDLLVDDSMRTYGGLCYNGSCQMMDEYGSSSGSSGANMFLTWHIFGDPSLVVRTATPAAMSVQHSGALFPGQTDYAVTVTGVPGALCALYAVGTLYGSAYTNAAGAATIHMANPPLVPGTLTLTVTAFNKLPVETPVQVLPPSGPYLILNGTTVFDQGGDADGVCDAGEAVGLDVQLKNIGAAAAANVVGTLSSTSSDVVISAGQRAYGNIGAGAIVSVPQPFAVSVLPNTPDQTSVPFVLTAQATEGSWTCPFTLVVQAPVLTTAGTMIDDTYPGGNGSGGADAGETFYLMVQLTNGGHSASGLLSGLLSCESPYVQIPDPNGTSLSVPVGGGTTMSVFQVTIDPACPQPSSLTFHLAASNAAGLVVGLNFDLSVGPWVDDAEADRGWTCGWPGDTASTGQWERSDPVGTTYGTPPQQAQPEDDHTTDPGHVCFVTGNGVPGGLAGDSDVDGGATTLMSPVFNLDGATSATLSYWRWYTNNLGNNPSQDYWDVQVTADGTNWVNLEHTTDSANSWNQYTFDLRNYVTLTDQVRVRFVAADVAPGTLVEAAVDDIMLIVVKPPTTDVPVEQIRAGNGLVSVGPNPLRGPCSIVYAVASAGAVQMGLYDVSGRQVRALVNELVPAGEHEVKADLSRLACGIYFLRLETPRVMQVKQVTVLR
jgi:hypothetical protein